MPVLYPLPELACKKNAEDRLRGGPLQDGSYKLRINAGVPVYVTPDDLREWCAAVLEHLDEDADRHAAEEASS